MASYWVFLVLLGIGLLHVVYSLVTYMVSKFIKKEQVIDLFDYCFKIIFMKETFVPFLLALLAFGLASVLPYMLQQRDKYLISDNQKNIVLINTYIDDYTAAAQKQISEFDAMRSKMAASAIATQLQYYSQQIDAVGNELANKIKSFKDQILQQQMEINRAQARIEVRPKNKWFFGVG